MLHPLPSLSLRTNPKTGCGRLTPLRPAATWRHMPLGRSSFQGLARLRKVGNSHQGIRSATIARRSISRGIPLQIAGVNADGITRPVEDNADRCLGSPEADDSRRRGPIAAHPLPAQVAQSHPVAFPVIFFLGRHRCCLQYFGYVEYPGSKVRSYEPVHILKIGWVGNISLWR